MEYLSIENATIIDGTGNSPLKNASILSRDDRVVEIGAAGSFDIPEQAIRIDASRKYIIPGLIDAHNHLCNQTGNIIQHLNSPDGTLMLHAAKHARSDLASGVTTMRTVGEKNLLDIQYRDGIDMGLIPGPRVLAAAWPISSTGGHGWFFGRQVDGATQIRQAVRDNCKEGADLIKMMISGGAATQGSVPWVSYFTQEEIQAAIDEAHRLGRKVAGHLYGGLGADWALNAGIDTVEHGCYLTDQQLEMILSNGTFLIATLSPYLVEQGTDARPAWAHKKVLEAREGCIKIFKKAMQMGIKMAFGPDNRHEPFSMAREISLAVDLGMSEMDAIVHATAMAAEACGLQDEVGTLKKGKLADLLILTSDPLQDINALRELETVIQGGRVIEL